MDPPFCQLNPPLNGLFSQNDEIEGFNKSTNVTKVVRKKYQHGNSKRIILDIIASSEPDGETASELAKETGLHRDTIRIACNSLSEENTIVRSGGKFGKYHLAPKVFDEDPGLNAFLFRYAISKKFNEFPPLCLENIFCNTKFCKETWYSEDYYNPDNIVDEVYFFEFALKLGAVITYELLQAIRFSQLQLPSQASPSIRDDLLIKYIKNAVTPLTLIMIFRKLFPVTRRLDLESEYNSWLQMQHDKFDELQRIFKNTFSDLFMSLEKIRIEEIPKQIDWKKCDSHQLLERMKLLEKEDPGHTKCSGELLPHSKTNIKGKKVQRCSKCLRWIEIRRTRNRSTEGKRTK